MEYKILKEKRSDWGSCRYLYIRRMNDTSVVSVYDIGWRRPVDTEVKYLLDHSDRDVRINWGTGLPSVGQMSIMIHEPATKREKTIKAF